VGWLGSVCFEEFLTLSKSQSCPLRSSATFALVMAPYFYILFLTGLCLNDLDTDLLESLEVMRVATYLFSASRSR